MSAYQGRRAVQIENDNVRVTVLVEGGHVAEILHKQSGVNPLWTPPWPSIEPSTYSLAKHPEYGDDSESKLLAGIMGHNLCLDTFGPPTDEEAAAGMTVHGEGSVVEYAVRASGNSIHTAATLPEARLRFTRALRLEGNRLVFEEEVENLSALDRPIAWTQHVTLGPPFIERGATQFRAPVAKSFDPATERPFIWPHAPKPEGGTQDLTTYPAVQKSENFNTHLIDPHGEKGWFAAWSPSSKVLIGYIWQRSDFPWLAIWQENHSRKQAPWNGRTLTCGMEFGASPLAETRKAMIERNRLFEMPCYRWIPAKSKARVSYSAFVTTAASIPQTLDDFEVHVAA